MTKKSRALELEGAKTRTLLEGILVELKEIKAVLKPPAGVHVEELDAFADPGAEQLKRMLADPDYAQKMRDQ